MIAYAFLDRNDTNPLPKCALYKSHITLTADLVHHMSISIFNIGIQISEVLIIIGKSTAYKNIIYMEKTSFILKIKDKSLSIACSSLIGSSVHLANIQK